MSPRNDLQRVAQIGEGVKVTEIARAAPSQSCASCGGLGMIRTGPNTSGPCHCQQTAEQINRMRQAQIPPGFAGATLSSYQATEGTKKALHLAQKFVSALIPGQHDFPGLLFTGGPGLGKTHLAIGILRELIEQKGIRGRFVDVRELLDRLRSSYDAGAHENQAQILGPILSADLVVIDELGAARSSEWVFETQELLIGGLYNRTTPVIVTTNLENLPAGSTAANQYERAARAETLGDRIGMRMFSRLQQMCYPVRMTGEDWRLKR